MSGQRRSRSVSMTLSHLLRHGANDAGLAMDPAGWSLVDDVLMVLGLTVVELTEAIEANTKNRLERDGNRMRASQGHSLAGTPVTLEALEASWTIDDSEDDLWHGTTTEAAALIAKSGLLPGARTHVHLARSVDARVGKRTNVDVVIQISRTSLRSLGITVWQAPNDVLLARHVPANCIVWDSDKTTRA
jgi:putative RNA 2'-phosphotransferase